MNPSALFKRITNSLQHIRYGDRTRPLRDWLIIACIVLVLFIGAASWSYYIFNETSSAEVLKAPTAMLAPISTASLETVMNVFQARATERAHYLSDYHFVDPSK